MAYGMFCRYRAPLASTLEEVTYYERQNDLAGVQQSKMIARWMWVTTYILGPMWLLSRVIAYLFPVACAVWALLRGDGMFTGDNMLQSCLTSIYLTLNLILIFFGSKHLLVSLYHMAHPAWRIQLSQYLLHSKGMCTLHCTVLIQIHVCIYGM